MKWILGTLVLLCAISLMAQQAGQPSLPENMPQPSVGEQQSPATMPNADVKYQIQSQFSTNADLNNTNLNTIVTDDAVTVNGYVDNQQQHDFALDIAKSYSGNRQVVDNIQVGGNQIQ